MKIAFYFIFCFLATNTIQNEKFVNCSFPIPKQNSKERDRERKWRCLKDFGTEDMGGLAIAEKGRVG